MPKPPGAVQKGGGLTSPLTSPPAAGITTLDHAAVLRGAPHAIPAPPPPPSHVLHASAIEVEGERVVDLLGGGTPLSVSADGLGPPKVNGAVQARIETLDDAAYTLKAAMRTRSTGARAARLDDRHAHAAPRGGGGESTLTFVDLAGGDPMLGGSAAAVAPGQGRRRALARGARRGGGGARRRRDAARGREP